jgi:RNA polymerase sigma-70 factor (ECF subfamily)
VDYSETVFEKLLVEHQNMIHKVCNIYEHSAADKEDLFQEITIQLWRSFGSFEGKSKFSTWLYRVALNTALTRKRKQKAILQTTSISDRENQIPESSENESQEEDLRRLHWAIQKLKPIDRAIIFLYLEEKSYQEIASIIGITTKNVGVKVVRIKARLLNILGGGHGK